MVQVGLGFLRQGCTRFPTCLLLLVDNYEASKPGRMLLLFNRDCGKLVLACKMSSICVTLCINVCLQEFGLQGL